MFGEEMMMAAGGGLNVDEVFATTLYTTASGFPLVPTPFAPDFVWQKVRSASSSHVLVDTVRGRFKLDTSTTGAQEGLSTGQVVLQSNGYTHAGYANGNQAVGWAAKFAPRFLVAVAYTGNGAPNRQIPHDLGVQPGLMTIKIISGVESWYTYHRSRGPNKFFRLNTTDAEQSDTIGNASLFGNSDPSATHFTVGTSVGTNANGQQYVAYLFAHDPDPDGIIQCGQYTGNGSTTGPVVTLGWEPQWLFSKRAVGGATDWFIRDNKRSASNPRGSVLRPNATNAENSSGHAVNFTATGFSVATNSADHNASGSTYIYCAIRNGAA